MHKSPEAPAIMERVSKSFLLYAFISFDCACFNYIQSHRKHSLPLVSTLHFRHIRVYTTLNCTSFHIKYIQACIVFPPHPCTSCETSTSHNARTGHGASVAMLAQLLILLSVHYNSSLGVDWEVLAICGKSFRDHVDVKS